MIKEVKKIIADCFWPKCGSIQTEYCGGTVDEVSERKAQQIDDLYQQKMREFMGEVDPKIEALGTLYHTDARRDSFGKWWQALKEKYLKEPGKRTPEEQDAAVKLAGTIHSQLSQM